MSRLALQRLGKRETFIECLYVEISSSKVYIRSKRFENRSPTHLVHATKIEKGLYSTIPMIHLFTPRRLRRVTIFLPVRDGKSLCTPAKESFEIFARGHALSLSFFLFLPVSFSSTLSVLSILRVQNVCMRITLDNLERKGVSYDISFVAFDIVVVVVVFPFFFLSLLLSSRHARGERDSEKFFSPARDSLAGNLMELKSFRDAHRCVLYSHAA